MERRFRYSPLGTGCVKGSRSVLAVCQDLREWLFGQRVMGAAGCKCEERVSGSDGGSGDEVVGDLYGISQRGLGEFPQLLFPSESRDCGPEMLGRLS